MAHANTLTGQWNQLRDPAIFEENGQLYLLYTAAGEQAIGITKLA